MKKKKIIILLAVLALLIGCVIWGTARRKSTDKCMDTIKEIISAIDNRDWDKYLSYLEESKMIEMRDYYFAQVQEDSLGINQVTGAELKNSWLLDYKDLEQYISYNEYDIYTRVGDENIFGYLMEVYYDVSINSSYFRQGINHHLWIFVLDGDTYKLVEFSTPSSELVEKYVNDDNAL